MARPLIQHRIGDLEELFAKSKADLKVLKQLQHELQYRQVPRAVALLADVQAAMEAPNFALTAGAAAGPAPPPRQSGLWERPTVQVARPATAPIAPAPAAPRVKSADDSPVTRASPPTVPTMPLEEAYKLLKSTPGMAWESIEQSRRRLVQQSHPSRLTSLSPEKRSQAVAEARLVNAAYASLAYARSEGQ
jgi:hypothetical protein